MTSHNVIVITIGGLTVHIFCMALIILAFPPQHYPVIPCPLLTIVGITSEYSLLSYIFGAYKQTVVHTFFSISAVGHTRKRTIVTCQKLFELNAKMIALGTLYLICWFVSP